jgi:hypothetical protein
MSALTTTEIDRLAACERSIEQGISVFVEVGRALTEIRDSKLYRATHKTFEAYCKERWEIGRSRAYDLIDQAKVTEALTSAGLNLSDASDISVRDARALKDDPKAAASVKSRVDAGEKPAEAIKAVAVEKKAEIDRGREETAAKYSPEVQEHRARTDEYRAQAKAAKATPAGDVDALRAEIEEKDEYIASLEADVADLKRQIAKYDDMIVQFEQGGFDKIIAGKDEEIRVLETRFYSTNADMISWKKKAAWEIKEKLRYKHEAEKRGYSDDIDLDRVDPETGEVMP